jgi:hypothetical protein
VPNDADVLAIRQLVERYADAVCQRNAEQWGSTWAPDAVWDLGARKAEGRENIVQLWLGAMGVYQSALQVVNDGEVLEVDGDRAKARWYITEYLHPADGPRIGIGVYFDDYVRIDGQWHFAQRKYNIMYSGKTDLTGTVTKYPG